MLDSGLVDRQLVGPNDHERAAAMCVRMRLASGVCVTERYRLLLLLR